MYSLLVVLQSLQAPACHENMIKVGGYVLGEFGNLIAGDSRSAPMIQFELLHSKFPFCSIGTRALLLSTYIKFINLYPEIKAHIQAVFEQDTQSRNADLEVQQRAIEYLKLSHLATTDLMVSLHVPVLYYTVDTPQIWTLSFVAILYKTTPKLRN